MAKITLNIDDTIYQRVLDAFSTVYGRTDMIPDPNDQLGSTLIPNPESKEQFLIRQIQTFVKGAVKAGEVNIAADQARRIAATHADNEIIISGVKG